MELIGCNASVVLALPRLELRGDRRGASASGWHHGMTGFERFERMKSIYRYSPAFTAVPGQSKETRPSRAD